ncbi:hypothetical protein [Dethiosulfatarculus sandiegensis]|nr:hypothetical protein [Dethiosulfatarculus sandiegensis]
MEKSAHLNGLASVALFTGYSQATVRKHKQLYPGMPINKINGRWVGSPERLKAFYNDLAAGEWKKYI